MDIDKYSHVGKTKILFSSKGYLSKQINNNLSSRLIDESQLLPGMFCAGGPGLGIDTCQVLYCTVLGLWIDTCQVLHCAVLELGIGTCQVL